MANSFMQNRPSHHTYYEQRYKTSRMNLLLVVILTVINLLLLVTNADSYFLFSAFIPYFIASIGMLVCGRFPEEYYTEDLEGMVFIDNSVFVFLLIISLVLTFFYLLAWFMSRKQRVGWLIFALVFFSIDTLGMLIVNGIYFESILDIIMHAWVIYYLIVGISAHSKLKKLPTEQEPEPSFADNQRKNEGDEENANVANTQPPNSYIIREANNDVKHRVLLEAHVLNYDICYRRVKHTNELVINGNVYDELEAVIESSHTLKAWVDGHYISAGYNGTHSFISVDGENAAKKIRLF